MWLFSLVGVIIPHSALMAAIAGVIGRVQPSLRYWRPGCFYFIVLLLDWFNSDLMISKIDQNNTIKLLQSMRKFRFQMQSMILSKAKKNKCRMNLACPFANGLLCCVMNFILFYLSQWKRYLCWLSSISTCPRTTGR